MREVSAKVLIFKDLSEYKHFLVHESRGMLQVLVADIILTESGDLIKSRYTGIAESTDADLELVRGFRVKP